MATVEEVEIIHKSYRLQWEKGAKTCNTMYTRYPNTNV